MLFLDIILTITLSCEFRVHRARSQLKRFSHNQIRIVGAMEKSAMGPLIKHCWIFKVAEIISNAYFFRGLKKIFFRQKFLPAAEISAKNPKKWKKRGFGAPSKFLQKFLPKFENFSKIKKFYHFWSRKAGRSKIDQKTMKNHLFENFFEKSEKKL